jgi:hypothetical protein
MDRWRAMPKGIPRVRAGTALWFWQAYGTIYDSYAVGVLRTVHEKLSILEGMQFSSTGKAIQAFIECSLFNSPKIDNGKICRSSGKNSI